MKFISLSTALLVLSGSLVALAESIAFTSPSQGDHPAAGSQINIAWTVGASPASGPALSLGDTLTFTLTRTVNGQQANQYIGTASPSSGQLAYTIPSSLTPSASQGDTYIMASNGKGYFKASPFFSVDPAAPAPPPPAATTNANPPAPAPVPTTTTGAAPNPPPPGTNGNDVAPVATTTDNAPAPGPTNGPAPAPGTTNAPAPASAASSASGSAPAPATSGSAPAPATASKSSSASASVSVGVTAPSSTGKSAAAPLKVGGLVAAAAAVAGGLLML
ncbi:uncharacterized protein BJ171DRAFT_577171 [Polychytrium aggregatum]|uniref:uncharacterized protein n=1 Tax=Polychytrium aggregatum TaxID=110093 RepID=UPI0022FE0258|nr:uncharacterized protein BJ171DRAFT_577171 [Polychytrium aggregatum]KAI9208820.1 hypothetical protein BJ171DRAFT_577171 [Polychytrium aggregatum]